MGATSIGLTGLKFGLSAETGVVVQNFTSTQTMETSELSDVNGQFAAVAFSNKKINISISGNATTGEGTVGATLASIDLDANATAVSAGQYFITDTSVNATNDGFISFDISATQFSGLSVNN